MRRTSRWTAGPRDERESMTRVLVTGATGFIGRTLVPALAHRGYRVRLALRRETARWPDFENCVVGDINGATHWSAAMDGVDHVVHLAARVHVMQETASDPLAAFRATNVAGTHRLAVAAAAAGVKRFVHLSSVKALREVSDGRPLDDETLPAPSTPYGLSKREAELALADAARGGLDTVSLRLPLVYGPGVKGNFRTLLDLCWQRRILPLASIRNRRSLLFVGNLADAVVRILEAPGPLGGAHLVCDGSAMSTPALIRDIGETLGRRARLVPFPTSGLKLAGTLLRHPGLVDRLLADLAIDDAALRHRLNWRPPYDLSAGLHETVMWYVKTQRGL
jgi:nucleoside-diphosphate-sugar epimerase